MSNQTIVLIVVLVVVGFILGLVMAFAFGYNIYGVVIRFVFKDYCGIGTGDPLC